MADKKRIQEAMRNGVFESPVGNRLRIAGTELKSNEKGYEITVGEDIIKKLNVLGINQREDGTMVIPVHNTEKAVAKVSQEERQNKRVGGIYAL